jgi:hypothetical protein
VKKFFCHKIQGVIYSGSGGIFEYKWLCFRVFLLGSPLTKPAGFYENFQSTTVSQSLQRIPKIPAPPNPTKNLEIIEAKSVHS